MKRVDIASRIVETTNLTQAEAEEALFASLDSVKEALRKGEKVTLIGFGSFSAFSVVEKKARTGRHPKTGEPIEIPALRTVKFKPVEKLKEVLT
jgi:DNA-binding protein HU-beta